FDNGKIKTEGTFLDGKRNGVWTTFFIDGKTAKTENYDKGKYDGENVSYFKNGIVESKQVFKKGDIDGTSQNFDDDGIMYSEIVFEKGRLRDIKFFDKKTNVISNTTSRKGDATIQFYDANANKISEGYYDKNGSAN